MNRLRINWGGLNTGFSIIHTTGSSETAQLDADALDDFLQAIAANTTVTQTFQVDTEVEQVEPATGAITGVTSITSINRTGSNNTPPVPQAAQALVRWRTGTYVSGREIRGRTFIPGLALATSSASGELASATASAIQAAAAQLLEDSGIAIWSPTRGQVALVTSTSVWSEFAVMRSRRD